MTPEQQHARHVWVFQNLRRDARKKLDTVSPNTDGFRTIIDLLNACDWALDQLDATAVTSKVVTEGT